MPLPEHWAKPEDFATLFQYLWHRDFPIDPEIAIGAKRIDWTIHIGVIVRSIADLMGFVTRFERRGRKDAILRSADGDEVAIEWEWEGIKGNELQKLKEHEVWSKDKGKDKLKYAVLITYVDSSAKQDALNHAVENWGSASWPLLLIFVVSEKTRQLTSGRLFNSVQMHLIAGGKHTLLRDVPAVPWQVENSRWHQDRL